MQARTAFPENEATRRQVLRIFEELTMLFGTDYLYLKLVCSDGAHGTDPECAADTEAKWQYRQAKITVYLPSVTGHSDGQIRQILAHEIIHAVLAPMEDLVKEKDTDRCELAVESMTRCFLRAIGKENAE